MNIEDGGIERNYDNEIVGSGSSLEASIVAQGSGADPGRFSFSPLRYNKLALLVTGLAIAVILVIALGSLLFAVFHGGTQSPQSDAQKAASFPVSNLALGSLKTSPQLQVSEADHLVVNGQLRVSNTLVLTPGTLPSSPTAGQIYYDQSTNAPYYYNGTQFISLAPTVVPQHVTSIGGTSGSISVGSGLQITGSQLALTNIVTQELKGLSGGQGVTSLQGQTGTVTLTGGKGIGIDGTTISNNGVISLAAGSSSIVISQDGNGNYTLSDNAVVGSGSVNQIALFTGAQTLGGSILSQSGSSLDAAGSLEITGAVSSNTFQQTAPGNDVNVSAGSDNLIFTDGGRTFMFPVTGPSSQTICTTGISCASGGGQAVLLQPGSAQLDTGSGSSLFVNNTGGGNLLELQGAGSDRFVVTNAGNVTIAGSLTLSSLGAGVIQANGSGVLSASPVVLGTETTGNYVAALGTLTGLGVSGNSGAGSTPALSVTYGSTSGTAVQGSTTLVCPSGTGNLTGTGNTITLGTGGSCNSLGITNSPTFTGALAVQGSGGITVGSTSNVGIASFLDGTADGFTTSVQTAVQANDVALTIPADTHTTDTICLQTLGNCVAAGTAGGDLSGTYPNPSVAKLQGTSLSISSVSAGQILQVNALGTIVNQTVTGDVTINSSGDTAIGAGKVSNTDLANSSLTVTAGTGLTGGGSVSLGASSTGLSVTYGSTSGTAVQGSTTLVCPSGTGNLTGTGNTITLGTGGTCNSLNVVNSPTFSGTLAVQGGTATIGTTTQQGSLVLNDGNGASNETATLEGVATLGQNTVYTLPDPGASTATICLSTGNCAGSGGAIIGSGTSGVIAKFNGSGSITDSTLSESGTTLTASGNVAIQGANSLTLGVASTNTGSIIFQNGTNGNTLTLQSGVSGSDFTLTLPTTKGNNGDCLESDGSGALSFQSCTGGAGGGVTSLDSQTGLVTLSNSSGSGGTVTINNAKADAATKGIATFNATNFSDNGSGVINTIQDIATGSAPTFSALTLQSNTTGLSVTGAPAASATSSLIQLGSAIANGNTATNGGTYIGLNEPSSGAGSAADFLNFQVNGISKLQVTNEGALTEAGALTVSTGGLTVGTASSSTGLIVFQGSGGAGTLTLQGPTNPNAGNFTLSIPAITADANICTDNSVCSGYAASSGDADYIQNQDASPQTGANFDIDGSGTLGTNLVVNGTTTLNSSVAVNSYLTVSTGLQSTTQTDLTQALTHSSFNIVNGYVDGAYTPGVFWSTYGNNPNDPKAGIYTQDTNTGSYLLFGTSDSYAAGLTNTALSIDPSGNATFGSDVLLSALGAAGSTDLCLNGSNQIGTCSVASSTSLQEAPGTTAQNTITPSVNGVVGLTVNATSGTAAVAAIFNQSQAADGIQLNATNTSGTETNGILLNRNGSGGTTTNGLNITNTLGTITNGIQLTQSGGTFTNGIDFTGTFTDLLNSTNFSIDNGGDITNSGTYNTDTFTSSMLQFGAGSTATIDSASGQTLQIGTGANAHNLMIGNTTGTTAVTIQGGTGAISLSPAASGTILIGSAAQTGTITLGSSSATQTVLIGNGTGASTVTIASGTGANTVNAGSSNAGSTVNLTGGNTTENITNTGAVIQTNTTNSTTAFEVQNAGHAAVLNVDTQNSLVTVQGINSNAALGSEMMTGSESLANPTTGWTAISGTGTSVTARHTSGGGVTPISPTPALSITSGLTYQVTFIVTGSPTAGQSVTASLGGASGEFIYGNDASEVELFTATTTANLAFTPTNTWNGTISGVSVKLVTLANAALQVQDSSGDVALQVRTSGAGSVNFDTFVGDLSGEANITGTQDTALGTYALQSNTTGGYNTAVGMGTLLSNTTGSGNTALGNLSLESNTTGSENTALGDQALQSNTTGTGNSAIGPDNVLASNTTGSENTADGYTALAANTTGSDNTALGAEGLQHTTTGSDNATLGFAALFSNSTGGNNVALGYEAGYTSVGGNANTTGSNNTFIGYSSGPGTSTQLQNASAFGTYSVVDESNALSLGCVNATNGCTANTLVGVDTATPGATFDVQAVSTNVGLNVNTTGTGNLLQLKNGGTSVATVTSTGAVTLQNSTNSTAAFQIQNSSSAALLTADTTDMRLGVNVTYAAMGTPSIVSVGTPTSGGSLTASTTYCYKVTAIDSAGGESAASSQVCSASATTSSNKTILVTWSPVTGASGYRIYHGTTGAETGYYSTLGTVSGSNLTYSDTGASQTNSSATPPSTNTAYTSTTNTNNNLQLSVGGNGTPTSQLYVSGTVPSGATGSIADSQPNTIYVQGHYAYTGSFEGGNLNIYDISNPATPVSIGSVGANFPVAIYVSGRYAYTASTSNNTLGIIDVSNPAAPSFVGSIGTTSEPEGIYVSGHYAYVIDTSGTLQVFDVSNPSNPVSVGSVAIGSEPAGIYVSGSYAYVAGEGNNDLEIINISNPTNPTFVGSVATGINSDAVYVSGSYAYVVNAYSNTLQVIDISNPAAPVVIGSVATGSSPESIYVSGQYAYVANEGSNNLGIYDVANPAAPFSVGTVSTGSSSEPESVYVSGRYAYTANYGTSTLGVFDLGGAYIQQLQAGATETGTLQVDADAAIGGDASIQGGLEVGASLQVAGGVGVNGNLNLTASTMIAPSAPSLSKSASGGSLPAATYYYELAAVNANGTTAAVASSPTDEVDTGSASKNTLTWSAVTGATGYIVYESTNGTTWYSNEVSSATTSIVDNGTNFTWTNQVTPPLAATTGGDLTVGGTALFQDAANSTTAFQILNATGTTTVLDADTTHGRLGVGTNAPGNLLSVGTLTTADSAAQLAVGTGGTGNKGIVIQAVASQSADLLDVESSSGSVLFGISATGHIITGGGTLPSATPETGDGSTGTCTVAGDDTAGTVTITPGGSGIGTGLVCQINFTTAFGTAPRPVIAPTNAAGSAVQAYVSASATGNFTVSFNGTPSAQAYTFNWFSPQ